MSQPHIKVFCVVISAHFFSPFLSDVCLRICALAELLLFSKPHRIFLCICSFSFLSCLPFLLLLCLFFKSPIFQGLPGLPLPPFKSFLVPSPPTFSKLKTTTFLRWIKQGQLSYMRRDLRCNFVCDPGLLTLQYSVRFTSDLLGSFQFYTHL